MICYVDSHFQVFRNRYTCVLDQCDLYIFLDFKLIHPTGSDTCMWLGMVVLGCIREGCKSTYGTVFVYLFGSIFLLKLCRFLGSGLFGCRKIFSNENDERGRFPTPKKRNQRISVFYHFVPYV